MIRVRTGSRLHFGLLGLADAPRPFGGVGLMIEEPGITVSGRLARMCSATGPLADRVLSVLRSFDTPCAIEVDHAAPEHVGLGTGTQLALAVGVAVSRQPLDEIVRRTGRGRRSAIGAHGFLFGGLLVDGGKRGDGLAPLVARHNFPDEWRVVVAIPDASPGLAGQAEMGAFQGLRTDPALTERLCRLVLLGLLPALVERDLPAFSAALGELNAKSGELFAPIQGGPHSVGPVSDLIAFVRSLGVEGVGQSSWGPGVFAIVEADRADWLRDRIAPFGLSWVTKARNRGADVIQQD